MPLPIDSDLVAEFNKRIDDIDERAKNTMAGGLLRSFDEYRFSAGYRKALADAKTVIRETFEDIMKE